MLAGVGHCLGAQVRPRRTPELSKQSGREPLSLWLPRGGRRVSRCIQKCGVWAEGLPGPQHPCLLAASMAPQRKSDFSRIVLRALCTGTCVSLANACVAGECRPGGVLSFEPHPGPDTGALAPLGVPGRVGSERADPAHQLPSLHRDPLCAPAGCSRLHGPPEHHGQQQQLRGVPVLP